MKHKPRHPEEEAVISPPPHHQPLQKDLSSAHQLVRSSPNVFPFRRKYCRQSSSQFLKVPPPSLSLLTLIVINLINLNLITAQVVDLGYGRTTSTIVPLNNLSLNGAASSNYYNTNQQIRDLRDFPDQQDVNWLSPNPFANRDKPNNPSLSSSYNDPKDDYRSNPNRNRIQQQYQNPNVHLPGYIVEDKPEHRGDPGDRNDPNYRPSLPGSPTFGDERYDGFGRNLPVDNRGYSSPLPPLNSNERGLGRDRDRDTTLQQQLDLDYQRRQFNQGFYNASRSGSMNLAPGVNPLDPRNNGGVQGPPNSNIPFGPNLPPGDGGGRNMPGGSSWNNIPGYPSVGPSSNLPGTVGNNYYPNGTRIPNTGMYPPGSNYPSNYPGGSSNYPGSNSNYPNNNYQGSGNPQYNNPNNPYNHQTNWRSNYPGSGGSGSTSDRDRSDGGRYNNRYPTGPINYPGRVTFNPGDPFVNLWNQEWSTTTYRPTAPGVLGRWRQDLQGQQRPEDINTVPQAVYVTTNYGRIQGYKVKIYDGPWVPLPARPGIANVDKMKSVVSSFMGIPYARAPVNEGRFRPPVRLMRQEAKCLII